MIAMGLNGNDTLTSKSTDCTTSSSENNSSSPASSTYGCSSPTFAAEKCFPADLDVISSFGARYGAETMSAIEGEDMSMERLQTISRESRSNLMDLTVSRTGRELQRYGYAQDGGDTVEGGTTGLDVPNCRLVTGCIPILPEGRILLISSTKSSDVFVLPKGGWEQDESLPVAALRETLEEAGVTGILGPPLPPLTYETKKSKFHRAGGIQHDCSIAASTAADNDTKEDDPNQQQERTTTSPSTNETSLGAASALSEPRRDSHTHNRLIIFPLYVQSMYDHWPEENRVRRSVSVDEAAVLLEHRPEFLIMLISLRERDLHLPRGDI